MIVLVTTINNKSSNVRRDNYYTFRDIEKYKLLSRGGRHVELLYDGDRLPYDFMMLPEVSIVDGIKKTESKLRNIKDYKSVEEEIRAEIEEIETLTKGEFVRKVREMINEGDNSAFWPEEYSLSEQGYIPDNIELLFNEFDNVWNRTLSFYVNNLDGAVASELLDFLYTVGIRQIKNHNLLNEVLKTIGEYFKIKGEEWSTNWRFYVDLQTCYRYYSKVDWLDVLKDTHAWFNPDAIMWRDERQYLKAFRGGIDDWFDKHWKQPSSVKYDTFVDYVESLDWGTNGATDMHVGRFKIEDRDIRVDKTKNASSVFVDVNNLVDQCLSSRGQKNKVSIKPDEAPNKTRVIVSSDTETYLLMSYLSQWTTDGFDPKVSTAYQNNKFNTFFWMEFMEEVRRGRICMPLDQKGFDHHVTKNMIFEFFTVLIERMSKISKKLGELAILLKRQIMNENASWSILIPVDKLTPQIYNFCKEKDLHMERKTGMVRVTGVWNGGIASGWRWTIDCDTIMNYAELHAITTLSYQLKDAIIWNIFQGDDLAPIVSSMDDAVKILTGYRYCGLEINVRKFFISRTRHEFLRKVVQDGHINGYPARGVHSLLWRANTQAARKDTSPWSIADLWMIQMRRGFVLERIVDSMVSDISGSFGLNKSDVADWLSTPASMGGYGGMRLFGWTVRWIRFEIDDDKKAVEVIKPVEKTKALLRVAGKYIGGISGKEISDVLSSRISWPNKDRDKRWKTVELKTVDKVSINHDKYEDVAPCEWKPGTPNIVKMIVVNRVLRGIESVTKYLTTEAATQFLDMNSHCSKNVLRDWMSSELKASFPKYRNYNNEFVGGFWVDRLRSMSRGLSKRKCNRNTLRSASLNVELEIYTSKKIDVYLGLRGYRSEVVIAQ